MSRVIFLTSPPSSAELGKDGNAIPGGLSMATWNFGDAIVEFRVKGLLEYLI